MRPSEFSHAVCACVGFSLIAGCGGSESPVGVPGTLPQTRTIAPSVARDPNNSAILYASNQGANKVLMYSYPRMQLQGTITGVHGVAGLCVDPATQNVWVVSFYGELREFKHGATQSIRKLSVGSFADSYGCAVNATTGDLAVTSHNEGSDPGGLYVFKNASGKPKYYTAPGPRLYWPYFVAYDSDGDAFVYGTGGEYRVELAELTPGAKKLQVVTPRGLRFDSPGGIQFDGTSLAIGDQKPAVIYRIVDGKVTGKTTLERACHVWQFFIDGNRIIAPNDCHGGRGRVSIYKYPAGGAPLKVLDGLKTPFAVVISR